VNYFSPIPYYPIDRGIPAPVGSTRTARYPFTILEVGESFFVPGAVRQQFCIGYYSRNGKRFATCRVTEDGVRGLRIWRIA